MRQEIQSFFAASFCIICLYFKESCSCTGVHQLVILIKSGCDSLCRRKSGRIPEFSSGISGKLYNSLRKSSHIRYKLLNFFISFTSFLTYKCIIDHLKADYVPNEKKTDKNLQRREIMFPVYEEKKNLHLHSRIARHESPHLHNSVEFIYLTEGCLELGMGQGTLSHGGR